MGDIFIPASKTILRLFDSNEYYQIPSFQRPYSWTNEEIEDLWNDIFTAMEDNDEEYFLGTTAKARLI